MLNVLKVLEVLKVLKARKPSRCSSCKGGSAVRPCALLYFAGREVAAGEELFTCYSRTYGKRAYHVPKSCADPRCVGAKHRTHSRLDEVPEQWRAHWRGQLRALAPPGVSQAMVE